MFLDGLAKTQISLQNLLHHVHGVNYSASDGVLCLIRSIVADSSLCYDSARSANPIRINAIDVFSVRHALSPWLTVGLLSDGRVLPL